MTVEPNSNDANVCWNHSFPASGSEFVIELTLDSKNQTEPRLEPSSLKLTSTKGNVGGTLIVLSVPAEISKLAAFLTMGQAWTSR